MLENVCKSHNIGISLWNSDKLSNPKVEKKVFSSSAITVNENYESKKHKFDLTAQLSIEFLSGSITVAGSGMLFKLTS